MAVPAVALPGCCTKTNWLAAAALTANVLLRALVKPAAVAVSCLPVPAASMRRLVYETVPLPPVVPMLNVVVPCSGPAPEVSETATLTVAPRPVMELFPN